MAVDSRVVLALVAVLLVAPIGAAVMISALLLFGVSPHFVFLPGFAVKSALEGFGFHLPNRVAVLTTAIVWWAIILLAWLALRRFFTSN